MVKFVSMTVYYKSPVVVKNISPLLGVLQTLTEVHFGYYPKEIRTFPTKPSDSYAFVFSARESEKFNKNNVETIISAWSFGAGYNFPYIVWKSE